MMRILRAVIDALKPPKPSTPVYNADDDPDVLKLRRMGDQSRTARAAFNDRYPVTSLRDRVTMGDGGR